MRQALNSIPLLFIIINIFSSCKNEEDKSINVFNILDHSLVTSSLNIESANNTIYHTFASRVEERRTMERAKIWQAKALMIKSLSDKEYDYIEQLKKDLKEHAGARFENGKEVFEKNNRNAASIIYNKSGEELLKRLKQYKISVLEVDPAFNKQFAKTIPIYVPEIKDLVKFKNDYFKNVTAISALASLSSFQNNIRNTENVLIIFCLNKVEPAEIVDPFITLLINQSSSIVKKNETITIKAGIGSYAVDCEPLFLIAGRKILPKKDDGYAVYKFKAASVPGKYKIPVAVEFLDENGNKKTMTREIVYEVVKDSND